VSHAPATRIDWRVADSDVEAVELLRARDPNGFDLAYASYRQPIYAFLFRLAGRRDVADDLFQETWLRLAEHAPKLRPDSDLQRWLFTVARNAYRSFARSKRAAPWAEAPNAREPSHDDGTRPDQRLALSDLERALLVLSVDERELLLLIGVDGLRQDTLAGMLGIEASTLRQRVTRARARLARELEICQTGTDPGRRRR
jgi:RNA polymerase sigma-70 factor, ECF subfamily